jgi:chitin disaccharide deacetylase
VTDRILVVNADDFGRAPGVNAGVARAHEQGIVTSATAMVRWPEAVAAAEYARRTPSLSVGLHLDLGEWEYADGEWRCTYQVVPTDDADAVAAEIDRQLARFHDLFGRAPTHLDSHQHVHNTAPVHPLLTTVGRRLGIPVRGVTPGIRYCGDFYGQDGKGSPVPEAITATALEALIAELPVGITELACHPGTPAGLESVYLHERAVELEALCAPEVHAAIERAGVSLVAFGALVDVWPPV